MSAGSYLLRESDKGNADSTDNSVTGTWDVKDPDNYQARDDGQNKASRIIITVDGNELELPAGAQPGDNADIDLRAAGAAGVKNGPAAPGRTSPAARPTAGTRAIGDLVFFKDGTWKYVLSDKADAIAAGEVVIERLNVVVMDEGDRISNSIVLTFTVVNSNDPAHGLSATHYVSDAETVPANPAAADEPQNPIVATQLDSFGNMRLTMERTRFRDIIVGADGTLRLPNGIEYRLAGNQEVLPEGTQRPAYVEVNGQGLILRDITSNLLEGNQVSRGTSPSP